MKYFSFKKNTRKNLFLVRRKKDFYPYPVANNLLFIYNIRILFFGFLFCYLLFLFFLVLHFPGKCGGANVEKKKEKSSKELQLTSPGLPVELLELIYSEKNI